MPPRRISFYLDSGGAVMGRFVLYVKGEKTAHVDTHGRVMFDQFQFRLPTLDWFNSLEWQYAGCLEIFEENMDIQVDGVGPLDSWYLFWKGQEWGRC